MDIKSSGVQGTAGGEGSHRPYMEKAEVYASLLIAEEMFCRESDWLLFVFKGLMCNMYVQ